MWHRRSEGAREINDLVTGAEAFVDGTYAEHLESLGRPVPNWAWMNCLAHGGEAKLSAVADERHPWAQAAPGRNAWHGMVSFLAADLLTLARARSQSVSTLQREVLVPLELDLATEKNGGRLGPAEVVNATLAALHGHPSTSR